MALPALLSPLLVAGAGATIGGMFGARSDRINRQFNAAEADKQRDWASEERDTAWQDTLADLRAAGVNPMHMFSKGLGATPVGGGSSASSSHASAPATAMAGAQLAATLSHAKLMNAQAAKTEAEIPAVNAGINEINARTASLTKGLEKISVEIDNVKADTSVKKTVQREINARIAQIQQLTRKYTAEANSAEAKARIDKEVADFQTSLGGDIERWSKALGIDVGDLVQAMGAYGAVSTFMKFIPRKNLKRGSTKSDVPETWGGGNSWTIPPKP